MKVFSILFAILMLAFSFGFSYLLAYGFYLYLDIPVSFKTISGSWLVLTIIGAVVDDIIVRKGY